jgi:hypothetical protein
MTNIARFFGVHPDQRAEKTFDPNQPQYIEKISRNPKTPGDFLFHHET